MHRIAVASLAAVAVLGLGGSVERVDLAGLASIELPSTFKPVGRGWGTSRPGNFERATLDLHRDDYQIMFRFEEDQHHVLGGYLADPVMLYVTLYNPNRPKPDATKIGATTIQKFYPPVNADWPRFNAHFEAQRWLPDIVTGDAVTRAAATNEGRGDDVVSGPPERWLVIHVDPTRRIRVDLYAWRKKYSVDEARTLARRIAESVQPTPKLAAMFDAVNGVEARENLKFERTVATALAALSECGIRSMGPGMVAWSDRCASWLSDDRRFLRIARTMGRIPLASFPARWNDAPEIKAVMPAGRASALVGPPDFRMAQLFWDEPHRRWSIGGFGDHLSDDDTIDADLVQAIVARLRDRSSIHLVAFASYDLKFWPERVAVREFFAEAERVSAALRDGKVVSGMRAQPYGFEP